MIPFNGIILYSILYSLHRNIFDFSLRYHLRIVFHYVFDGVVVCVGFLDGHLLHSRPIFILDDFPFVRNVLDTLNRFIIDDCSLVRHILHTTLALIGSNCTLNLPNDVGCTCWDAGKACDCRDRGNAR